MKDIRFNKENIKFFFSHPSRREKLPQLIILVVRTLIYILIIYLFIGGYLWFTRGSTQILKDIKQINLYQPKERNQYTPEQQREYLRNKIRKNPDIYKELQVYKDITKKEIRDNEKIYCWKDESGHIHYSNTGFPEGKIKRLWVKAAGNM
ncbi:MAG: hypothetical protein SCH71_06590 [Desulfobulbaceae bacterium]|nr:hypothetical protein [Desulfobulbaceae bacterium]